ncbi:hypothetical protein POM88_050951 [Heracleum sosnowskyi]|uniref:Leucine-rich repeat-containing N-terminal plant-type domain-containing protein n=1 Tax=Heracleum sosnowskyi TaxID=360622 RepID=A0AAD8GYJ2_9APIA|nr:hypothetical protein POM88_050951 [Heracleum sosnowskyi]
MFDIFDNYAFVNTLPGIHFLKTVAYVHLLQVFKKVHQTNLNHKSSSRRRILGLLIMPKDRIAILHLAFLLLFFILLTGRYVVGDSLDTDKQALLDLRLFLKQQNHVDRGKYTQWNPLDLSPCNWPGITCNNSRVTEIDLSNINISGDIYRNFSALTALIRLDLSTNSISGPVPADLGICQNLKFLNLSHNLIAGELNFTGLNNLETLDLSENRIQGDIRSILPRFCSSLVVANVSSNNLIGEIGKSLDGCLKLQYVDFSANHLRGEINFAFQRLKEFQVSQNNLSGIIQPWVFSENCSLELLDLSENSFKGELPKEISLCKNLMSLNLWGDGFTGKIPMEIGSLVNLQALILGKNSFDREIPESLLDLKRLSFLDLSKNKFSGDIQGIFGRMTQVKFLLLHGNIYTGGLNSSGIFTLPNIARIDLTALGNCSSLLWLNLAHNQISGKIPPELASIGKDPMPTFLLNRNSDQISAGSGECSAMKRWIPADYPPFSFVYTLLTMKKCRSLWDTLLKGYGLFSVCSPGTSVRTNQISGYIQLRHNQLSGELPQEIEKMRNFCVLHLGNNRLEGKLPAEIKNLPLMVLNITGNNFSGEIPAELGSLSCLQGLDLSYNNFSGVFPTSLSKLNDLNKFNISYNRYISGVIPTIGQLATFEKWSFVGDPLLRLPHYMDNTTEESSSITKNPRTTKSALLGLSQLMVELKIANKEGKLLKCGLEVMTGKNEKLTSVVNEICEKESESQIEIALLKSELHRGRLKAAAAEERGKREKLALELCIQHLPLQTQAVWRAEVAEKAKALLEEEIRKWKEKEDKRKVALEALRQESISLKNSFRKHPEPPKTYQPLGKILKMKF